MMRFEDLNHAWWKDHTQHPRIHIQDCALCGIYALLLRTHDELNQLRLRYPEREES